ncbi:hypothetical protein D6D20_09214 [Aureobasidium pullulans]|uniref:Uncharacterized protein n=1 Tax=Aureobasidium pullulans TaxID=5580 RepID=A0A4S8YMB6_AURPU|nr:hypothetical protein D6D20_09214 [Aureobasidium pullulans]
MSLGLLLAPMVFFTAVSALAISSTRTPHPQIYSKKLHSARIYEALTTKKNLRTLTKTVDAAATPGLAEGHPDLVHHALVLDAFATKKPWNTMTIEQDEVVYVTTTRKAAPAAVETGDTDLAAVVPPGTSYVEINTADAPSTVTHETESEVKTIKIKHTTTTPVHSTEIKTLKIKHTTTTPVHSTETKTNVLMHTTTTPVHSTVIETNMLMHTKTTVVHETKMKTKTVGAKREVAETQPAQSIEWQVSWSELVGLASAPSADIHARDAEHYNGGDPEFVVEIVVPDVVSDVVVKVGAVTTATSSAIASSSTDGLRYW